MGCGYRGPRRPVPLLNPRDVRRRDTDRDAARRGGARNTPEGRRKSATLTDSIAIQNSLPSGSCMTVSGGSRPALRVPPRRSPSATSSSMALGSGDVQIEVNSIFRQLRLGNLVEVPRRLGALAVGTADRGVVRCTRSSGRPSTADQKPATFRTSSQSKVILAELHGHEISSLNSGAAGPGGRGRTRRPWSSPRPSVAHGFLPTRPYVWDPGARRRPRARRRSGSASSRVMFVMST